MKDFAKAGLNRFRIRKGPYASDDSIGNYGAFAIKAMPNTTLFVIAADGDEDGWEHVSAHAVYTSASGKKTIRTPNWSEMCYLKNCFWDEEETVIQFHPPKSQYINNHPHVLHLWRKKGVEIELPPSILVGVKA